MEGVLLCNATLCPKHAIMQIKGDTYDDIAYVYVLYQHKIILYSKLTI